MTTIEVGMVNLRDSDLLLADPSDNVTGMTVLDPYGHRLGEVDELIIDELERRVRMLVVASGGILGLGQAKRLVPVEAITRIDETVHVDRSHEQVYQDQAYDPELTDYTDVYGNYGLAPFWVVSPYAPPYFHHRT